MKTNKRLVISIVCDCSITQGINKGQVSNFHSDRILNLCRLQFVHKGRP